MNTYLEVHTHRYNTYYMKDGSTYIHTDTYRYIHIHTYTQIHKLNNLN